MTIRIRIQEAQKHPDPRTALYKTVLGQAGEPRPRHGHCDQLADAQGEGYPAQQTQLWLHRLRLVPYKSRATGHWG